jgi:hypothetical protein
MLRSTIVWCTALALGPGPGGAVRGEEPPPPAGTWKVLLPLEDGQMQPIVLLKVENAEGKWTGKVLATAEGYPKAAIEDLAVRDGTLRARLKLGSNTLALVCTLPKEKGGKMTGSVSRQGSASPVELEPSVATSLDGLELLKDVVARQSAGYDLVRSALTLVSEAEKLKAKPEEVRSWAAKAVKAAEAYGPWQRKVVLTVAVVLADKKGYEPIALTYARQSERMLEPGDSASYRKQVLETLARALEKSGKADEAKEVSARIDKLDFTIKAEPFAGRKGDSKRAVLVELFTGTQCPPCVAADLAFDALGKAFKPSEVVRLQYHLHVPGPDPLTNADSEARAEYYGQAVPGTPTMLFNGRPAARGGGGREDGPEKFAEYREVLESLLEMPAKATLRASVKRDGAKLAINVEASAPEGSGDKLRLRLVLVEEQVAYKGSNKLAEHHHVVRAFPGGVEGEKLTAGKPFSKNVAVDLEQVRKDLKEYLKKSNEATPFPTKDRPLDLKNLRVVAFVQNDATREVLQAVQVDVAE